MKVKVHCQKVIDRDNSLRTAREVPIFFLQCIMVHDWRGSPLVSVQNVKVVLVS